MNQSLLNCVLAALISLTAASLMRRAPARCVLQSSQNRMIPRIGSFLFRARSSPSFMRSMLPLQMSFVRYRISVGLPRDGRGVRMWVDFCLAVLTGAAVLYGPGFFAWRALGMRGLAALSCAPLFSILAYSILGVVYFFLGVRSTALSVGLSVAVVSLAAYGLLLFVARRKGVALGSGERADRQFDAALVSAYLAVGVVVGLFAFVLPLDGPASSVQTYDLSLIHI